MKRLLILIFLVFLSTSGCIFSPKVGQWERFELELHEKDWQNPFTDVELEAVFTSPSGRIVRVDGFYDGDGEGGSTGDVFKVRFSPSETGLWRYCTQSNRKGLDHVEGKLKCIPSDSHGPLTYNPAYPRYLRWASGELFFESGANDPECFLADEFISQYERIRGIDYLASQGCNILYMGLVNAGPGDGAPGMKVTPWTGSPSKPDFNTICLEFMNRLEQVMDRMKMHDMVAHLVIYLDDCPEIIRAVTPGQEEMLFRYMAARFGSYPNLVWDLAEEFEECFEPGWCEERAALLKKIDPLKHPVTVHQLHADKFTFAGSGNFDLTAIQYNTTDPDSLNAAVIKVRSQLIEAGRLIPVSFVEWTPVGPEKAEEARRGIWAIAMGGGTYQIFNKEDKKPMSADFSRWEECWKYAGSLRVFMESLPLDKMEPANSMVSRGYCLAEPNGTCLVYQPIGCSFDIEFPLFEGMRYVRWFNPRTGLLSIAADVVPGVNNFKTPTLEDWALLILDSGE